jgi:transcriptional regulator with XRE-family HTH domain
MRGLTQGGLADLAGVSIGYVAKVEVGRANPKATTLAALAIALGVSPVELITGPT